MLKYMAILQALDRFTLGMDPQQLKRVTCLVYKSPALETEDMAKKWLELHKNTYPEKYYIVRDCVISFDESQKENVEEVLSNLIKMF